MSTETRELIGPCLQECSKEELHRSPKTNFILCLRRFTMTSSNSPIYLQHVSYILHPVEASRSGMANYLDIAHLAKEQFIIEKCTANIFINPINTIYRNIYNIYLSS